MAGTPITIIGNITGDPELKFTASGAAVTNFTVAVNERVFNKQTDVWEDGIASFYNCAVWRSAAENVAESLTKGNRVIVTGTFLMRPFDRKDGTKGVSADIKVDAVGPDLTFATATVHRTAYNGGGNNGGGNNGGGNNGRATAPAAPVEHDEPPF